MKIYKLNKEFFILLKDYTDTKLSNEDRIKIPVYDWDDILKDDSITKDNKELLENLYSYLKEDKEFIGLIRYENNKKEYLFPIYITDIVKDEEIEKIEFMRNLHEDYIEKNKNNKRRLDILKEEL